MFSFEGLRLQRISIAFCYAVPISLLGGLMGLGGAEFRLPVLAGPLGYVARQAVPLNLAVSLVTLAASLVTRARTLSLETISPVLPAALGLIAGAVVTAFLGPALASRLSEDRLERLIMMLLMMIGAALLIEAFLPQQLPPFLPGTASWHIAAGLLFGLAIGLVSSLLGVAGGELIIPTFVFAFGADIKTAGTASLLVSLPTVLVGIIRYAGHGAYAERHDMAEIIAPMGVGSVIGAVLGGILVGRVPAAVLKVTLGIILIISAVRIFHGGHAPSGKEAHNVMGRS
jgi:uncharacterized protein